MSETRGKDCYCGGTLGEIFRTFERLPGPAGGLVVKYLQPAIRLCSRCDFAGDAGGPPIGVARIRDLP